MTQEKRENVIKALELCTSKIETRTRVPCEICPYHNEKYHGVHGDGCCNMRSLQRDILALLKSKEPVKPNGEQHQCNKCKFYQGVHNVMGHAPCSFWNIGGVMWDDYCSRFSQFTDN